MQKKKGKKKDKKSLSTNGIGVLQLFAEQVTRVGDRVAVMDMGHGVGAVLCDRPVSDNRKPIIQHITQHITYRELNERANRLARLLHDKGVGPDAIVGIMMARSIEMIIGLLGIWKAGGAYLPIEPDLPLERINYMLRDSGARILISKSEIRNPKSETNPNDQNPNNQNKNFRIPFVLNFEHLNFNSLIGRPRRGLSNFDIRISDFNPSNLAYILYTSGSTGRPKGVLVEHGNLAAYLNAFAGEFKFTQADIVLQQASYTFDTFVEEVYATLLSGAVVAIADKQTVRDIDLLLEFIEKYNITVLDCVPLLLNELNEYCAAEHERKRLRSIHTFISGGDVLKYRHIDNLLKSVKVYNTYGPTETTVCATYYRCPTKKFQLHLAVPIGKSITGYHIHIVDPNGKPVPVGVVGELCISGAGVTRGYLNQPELTAEKYKSFAEVKGELFQKLPLVFYKTGDLACRLPGGNIAYMGRMDFQVKVRGIRIELKEIEAHLDAHPDIREATVTAREDESGDKYLAAYVAPVPAAPGVTNLDARALREYLAAKLPEYMIPSSFEILDRMPLTPTGKLDRWALMALSGSDADDGADEAGMGLEFTGKTRGQAVQEILVLIWQKILKIKKVGILDNFFQLGGHSLRVMKVISEIRNRFTVPVRAIDLFERPTIKELADFILSLGPDHDQEGHTVLEAVEKKDYYPASSLQKRFYILDRMENIGIAYNIPDVKILNGEITTHRLEESCRLLIRRHESLRTSFRLVGDELAQRIHAPEELEFHMSYIETITVAKPGAAHEEEINRILQDFVQPFDLNRAPLFRVCLVKLENEKYLFLYDLHHIIADGMSSLILEHEMVQLSNGRELADLAELTIQYKDFSQWQNHLLKSGKLKKQEDYWLGQFHGEIPALNLPLDYPPPAVQSFTGDAFDFTINTVSNRPLNGLLEETGTTLYMILLAVYNVLLARYTGQEDIIVGSPTAGRNPVRTGMGTGVKASTDLGNIIGLFINVMALRNSPAGAKTFGEFLREVKGNVLTAFENQEYPYGELIEKLALKKDLSKNPLFSAELVVHNMEIFGADGQVEHGEPGEPGAEVEDREPGLSDYGYHMKISQVDITLVAVEHPGEISCTLIYCTRLFKRETMERFARHFTRLLEYFQDNPNSRIADAPLLSDEEKQQILLYSNGIEVSLNVERCVYRLIEEQAERAPDRIAVIGSTVETLRATSLPIIATQITYRQLNEQSGKLAGLLIEKGIQADDIVGIMMERSVEMIIGLLGIWKAGGAYLPIDPGYPNERIDYMLKESGAKNLINKFEIRNSKFETNPNYQKINDQNKNQHSGAAFVSNFDIRISDFNSSNHLAYIIYTSGSTGRPKGVLVEHRNLAAYLTAFGQEFTITARDIVLQQASYTFDAFAEEVYPVLVAGGKVTVPATNEIADVRLLTNFITRQGVTIVDCSPLLLNELNKRLPQEAARTHLPTFTFISGGDVLKKEYIDRLLAIGNVYNTYGPTESTVCASYYRCTAEVDALPPIGRPIANYGLYILDNTGSPVSTGVVGELCIAGPGVTRGYLNQPELTAERFILPSATRNLFEKRFAGSDLPKLLFNHHSPLYRTGDLGRWLLDGNISFLGRIDSQVKIRGYRIELAEIEAQLVSHPEIKEALVVVREDKNEDKQLCAYVVAAVLPPGLREFLSYRLPSYMIPSYFAAIDRVPLTSLGKIDRRALPGYDVETPIGEYIAPGNLLEEKLAEIWADILDIEKKKIGTHANFFHLGGHSLKAALLVTAIHNELDAEISMVDIFKNPTIRDLSQVVKNSGRKPFTPLAATEKKEYYGLSPAQKRMYILQQWEPGSPGYNVSDAVSIAGKIDPRFIEDVFKKLVRRHESFRTSFHMKDREAIQKIHTEVEFKIEYFNLATDEHGQTQTILANGGAGNKFIRTFDLSQAPLLRVGLAEITHEQHLLVMDMHHIISDGISLYLLGNEFAALYKGEELPPLKFQYKDYAAWKNQRLERREEEIRTEETYWLKQFADQIPVLSLPQDYPRPAVKNFKGLHINFTLDKTSVQQFHAMAAEEDVTLYILLLAIFNIFVSRLSGSEDIVAGTPVAGRRHPDLRQIIGMFVNTLALRNFPVGEKNFFAFLKEVKGNFLEALENQDYEFEELVEKLGVKRDASRNPLFDVMFTLRSGETHRGASPHPEIQDMPPSYDYSHRVARFDLILLVVEDAEDLFFTLEYSTELFKEETAERFVRYFKKLASTILESPERKLAEFELITTEEKQELLSDFNNAPRQYPVDKTIPGLFEEHDAQAGDRIAVVTRETHEKHEKYESPVCMTYRQLNEQADGMARILIEKGVVPDTIVAIKIERSVEMIIGILGILKAGGAYLPIDPSYPEERIDYMLKDSGAQILIINKSEIRNSKFETNPNDQNPNDQNKNIRIPFVLNFEHLNFNSLIGRPRRGLSNFDIRASDLLSSNLAYIIYTSGSTGKPKGVLTTHANVIRVVKNTNYIELTRDDRVLQLSNYAFDGSVFDIYGALLNRAVLVLPGLGHVSSVPVLADLIKREKISIFFVTTALFNTLVDEALDAFENIRKVLFGGERVSVEHVEKAFAYMGKGRILHMYGPTETTVYAAYYYVAEKKERGSTIPIGKPISDTSIYILGDSLNPAPIGISGELYIGGGGVARGYLNNPELTFEKFKHDLWDYQDYHDDEKNKSFFRGSRGAVFSKKAPLVYRTGDLGCWLPGGNIEYIERKDRQVKIRGFRIEIGEIENRLLKHEAVKEALVTVREKDGDNYLCAYYILTRAPGEKPGARELKQYLGHSLPTYMIPAYFVPMAEFPLNPNGKLDKNQLPGPDMEELAGDYMPPRDEVEEKLVQIWSEVLGVDNSIIGINTNFFQLGGHSLKAIVMTDRIQINFNVKIQLSDLFQRQAIKELAEYIKMKKTNRETWEPETIEVAEAREYYPLTPEQERMFELHRFYGLGNRIFNMPWVGELEDTDEENLGKAFNQLIERHESLRTSFLLVNGKPVQMVHKQVNFKIEYIDLAVEDKGGAGGTECTDDKIQYYSALITHHFIKAFDLSKAPLLRVGVLKQPGEKILLLIDMHHIVSDGTSFGILLSELKALFQGNTLPPLRVQYKDYVQWQGSEERKKFLAKQEVYWLNLLSNQAPPLLLPFDFPRPAVRGMAADVINFELDSKEVKTLRELAKNENCSFFMVMLALFNVLLFKLTGREDIIVSTFFAGRRSPDLRKMVGMFVNTLLLRNYPTGEKQFSVFLNEVKQQTLNAYENQDYSRERLMKKKGFADKKSFQVDVNFVLQNMDPSERLMSGFQVLQSAWAISENENEPRVSFYDLRFEGFELEERLIFNVEYDINLFKEESIKRFIADFKNIVSSVLSNPGKKIAAI